MKRLIFAFLTVFGLLSVPVYADEVTVAILDLTPKGVPAIISNAISDIIRTEFVNVGNFTVVERSQMAVILKEQGLQMTGCTDSSCAVEVGKLLSARRIVLGTVNRIGGGIVINARYVDVESGKSLFSSSAKAPSLDSIDTVARKAARDLANRIVTGDKEILFPKTARGYYLRSAVPGWGQFYADEGTKGFVFGGAFLFSGIAAGLAGYNYLLKKKDYDGISRYDADSSIRDKRGAYEDAALYVNISLGVVAAVYLFNWIDAVFFTKGDFDRLMPARTDDGDHSFFSFNFRGFDDREIREMGVELGAGLRF